MKLSFLLALFAAASVFQASAQDSSVYVYGTIRERETMDSIPFPTVQVQELDQKEPPSPVVTQANGRYRFILSARKDYVVTFGAKGYITRSVEIDLRNIPSTVWLYGTAMNVDITLFKEMPGLDITLFKLPAGKARYDPAKSAVVWDDEYIKGIASRLNSLFQEYDRRQAVH
jgi:hypothetical protein